MDDVIKRCFDDAGAVLGETRRRLAGRIAEAASVIIGACRAGGGVFLFGNGGSAADAQHIACELVGRFLAERPAIKAEALVSNAAVMTAIGNDYDFERVFARQLEANGRPGDVAVGLSTSGDSANVVAGLAAARKIGMRTIAFTGAGGGRCAAYADVLLDVPARHTPAVQQAHMVMYHAICELVEAAFIAPP